MPCPNSKGISEPANLGLDQATRSSSFIASACVWEDQLAPSHSKFDHVKLIGVSPRHNLVL